jgi:hypothetical protein
MHADIKINHFRLYGKPTLTIASVPLYRPIENPVYAENKNDFWGYVVGMSLRHRQDPPNKNSAVQVCQGRILKAFDLIWKQTDLYNNKAPVPFIKNLGPGCYIVKDRDTIIRLVNFLRECECPEDPFDLMGSDKLYGTYREVFYDLTVGKHMHDSKSLWFV